jgi:CRP/FNR family transcriptional regulator, cyclic AMP receptor protein
LNQMQARIEISVERSILLSQMSKKMLFFGVASSSLEKVAAVIKIYEYPQGMVIFAEGEYGDSVYVLDEGRVELLQTFRDELRGTDHACLLEVIEASKDGIYSEKGDFFGEMCLLDLEPRSLKALTRSRTIVWEINRDDLYWLFGNDKELQLQILLTVARVLSRRLNALSGSDPGQLSGMSRQE